MEVERYAELKFKCRWLRLLTLALHVFKHKVES